MKSLYESLLDNFDTLSSNLSPIDTIKQFLKDNYTTKSSKFRISKKPNADGLYKVTCTDNSINVKSSATTLTNGLFKFADFDGTFYCAYNPNLTSLEGAPEKVRGSFDCSNCPNLTSLEGAPKEVEKGFDCSYCCMLKTLEGAPRKIGYGYAF